MSIFSSKKPEEERRKYIRLDAHHLVKYQVLEKGQELSFARNISAGGVRFVAKESIPIGDMVEIMINFPQYSHPIKTRAKVVWAKELKKVGGFEIGAEFVNVEGDAKDFIDKKIKEVTE